MRFGQSRAEDVATLIAGRNYTRAIEAIRVQLKTQRADARLRLQLGDTLALAGRDKEAVQVLAPLADEFAREGFAAKAVAVLKKVQKLDPGRRDIDAKLAGLIEQKQRQATVLLPLVPPPAVRVTLGIGAEPSADGSVSAPAAEGAAAADSAPAASAAKPVESARLSSSSTPAPPQAQAPPAIPAAAVPDQDFFTEDPELLAAEPEEEPEPAGAGGRGAEAEPDPMSDNAFAEELLALVEGAFAHLPGGADGVPMPAHDVGPADGGNPIVISPLFKDFSVDEMVAVIQGLDLLTFEPRQIILREGQPGDAMYMLAAGAAKAYVRNAQGRQVLVGELSEGAFFGEVSMLTGGPRTATVVAATRCELLELDRRTLDRITARHPHVREVLEEFARQRLSRRGAANSNHSRGGALPRE